MKTIKLTQNKVTIVDDEDFEYLSQFKWHYMGYAVRHSTSKFGLKRKSIFIHREVINAPDDMEVDHINGDKLDNRKTNLRICTHAENQRNRKIDKDNKSGYRGVSKHQNKWLVHLILNGKIVFNKTFDTPEEAALAYDEAAKKYHGRFAKLNFK